MPLLTRKYRHDRGWEIRHASGRILVPGGQQPAQWAFAMALRGESPTLDEIRTFLTGDSIPVAMIFKSGEKVGARYRHTLNCECSVNRRGWRLGHIEDVGLNMRALLPDISLDILVAHFVRSMSVPNMFLIPLAWSGLAELAPVTRAIAAANAPPAP